MTVVNLIFLAGFATAFAAMATASVREKEWRAVCLSILALGCSSLVWLVFVKFGPLYPWVHGLNMAAWTAIGLGAAVFWFPWFDLKAKKTRAAGSNVQYDERDHMFSRNNLQFYPELKQKYYSIHPEKKENDEKIFTSPELGEAGSRFYDPLVTPAASAAFSMLDKSRHLAKGECAPKRANVSAGTLTGLIMKLGHFYGAVDMGVVELKPYHFYSYAGRQPEDWGNAIDNKHPYGIVVVVAMDPAMMKKAPTVSAILESSRQYVEAAKIASLLGEYLRGIGFSARAHTDGNYQLLCVPAAVDSGLGELGRMGLFMHRVHGPCVRLAVVTTDAPLLPGKARDFHMGDFCRICKKCAHNCPTRSVSEAEEPQSRGFTHWSVNQETCFAFWKKIGTDCGFCIRVCPYTKPDTPVHALVRWFISRNPLNQRVALFFDDLLYRRRPALPLENPGISGIFH